MTEGVRKTKPEEVGTQTGVGARIVAEIAGQIYGGAGRC